MPPKDATKPLELFVSTVYRAPLGGGKSLVDDLAQAALSLAEDDTAGQQWCEDNSYLGYTSYASLNDLAWRMPPFKVLAKRLQTHANRFADLVQWDMGDRALVLDSLWVNVLPPDAGHAGHIHPHSVVSGTLYLALDAGASPLKLEDPRLGFLMAAPPKRADADLAQRPFVYLHPTKGEVILWESWLRHEVPPHRGNEPRISVSFNYRWG